MSHFMKKFYEDDEDLDPDAESELAAEEEYKYAEEEKAQQANPSMTGGGFDLSDVLFQNSGKGKKGKQKTPQNKPQQQNTQHTSQKKKPFSLLSSANEFGDKNQLVEENGDFLSSDYDKLEEIHFDLNLTHIKRLNFSQCSPNSISTIYVNDVWAELFKKMNNSSCPVDFSEIEPSHLKHVAYLTSQPLVSSENSSHNLAFMTALRKCTSIMDYASCVDLASGYIFVHGGMDHNSSVQNRLWAYNPKDGKIFILQDLVAPEKTIKITLPALSGHGFFPFLSSSFDFIKSHEIQNLAIAMFSYDGGQKRSLVILASLGTKMEIIVINDILAFADPKGSFTKNSDQTIFGPHIGSTVIYHPSYAPEKRHIILVYSKVLTFNTPKPECVYYLPGNLTNYTLTTVSPQNLLLFGGKKGFSSTNDMYWIVFYGTDNSSFRIFDLKKIFFSADNNSKKDTLWPEPRFGHKCIILSNGLWLFGGQNESNTFFNDVWVLRNASCLSGFSSSNNENYQSLKFGFFEKQGVFWQKIETSGAIPRGVSNFGMSPASKNSFFVMGGVRADKSIANSFFSFDIEANKWSIVSMNHSNPAEYGKEIQNSQKISLTNSIFERKNFDIINFSSKLFVFGGRGGDGKILDSFTVINDFVQVDGKESYQITDYIKSKKGSLNSHLNSQGIEKPKPPSHSSMGIYEIDVNEKEYVDVALCFKDQSIIFGHSGVLFARNCAFFEEFFEKCKFPESQSAETLLADILKNDHDVEIDSLNYIIDMTSEETKQFFKTKIENFCVSKMGKNENEEQKNELMKAEILNIFLNSKKYWDIFFDFLYSISFSFENQSGKEFRYFSAFIQILSPRIAEIMFPTAENSKSCIFDFLDTRKLLFEQLKNDFDSLLDSGKGFDCVFRFIPGNLSENSPFSPPQENSDFETETPKETPQVPIEEIHGHKLFFSRIPFFGNMFSSGMKEGLKEAIVDIDKNQISASGFKTIMKYIYTGAMEIRPEYCIEVWLYSLMTGITDLVSATRLALEKLITQQNAIQIYRIASFFKDPIVQRLCLDFICEERNQCYDHLIKFLPAEARATCVLNQEKKQQKQKIEKQKQK